VMQRKKIADENKKEWDMYKMWYFLFWNWDVIFDSPGTYSNN
jgi:hypothetical protein